MPDRQRLAVAWAALPGPVRGGIWMMFGAVCFAALNACIRALAEYLPPLQSVFFRNLTGLLFTLPWLLRPGSGGLSTTRHRLYFGRSLVGMASMISWFWAVSLMPLGEATALSFTGPLFATIAAVILLGEVVRLRRWTAIAVGFAGAMIVLRPGLDGIGIAATLVLMSSMFGGVSAVLVKQLTRTESASAILTYTTFYMTAFSAIPALLVWVNPPLASWPILVAMGLFATLGHACQIRAFKVADASFVMSFDFLRLPWVAIIAWFWFAETPDVWTWVGAAVIAAASIYTAHRETTLALAARAPSPAASAPIAANESATVATAGATPPHPPGPRKAAE